MPKENRSQKVWWASAQIELGSICKDGEMCGENPGRVVETREIIGSACWSKTVQV